MSGILLVSLIILLFGLVVFSATYIRSLTALLLIAVCAGLMASELIWRLVH